MRAQKSFVLHYLNGVSFVLPKYMKSTGASEWAFTAREFGGNTFFNTSIVDYNSNMIDGCKRIVDLPSNSSSRLIRASIKHEGLIKPTRGCQDISEYTPQPNGIKYIGWGFYLMFEKRFVYGEITSLHEFSDEEAIWNTVIDSYALSENMLK